jgi:hypothetical protein
MVNSSDSCPAPENAATSAQVPKPIAQITSGHQAQKCPNTKASETGFITSESLKLTLHMEGFMDTEKKSEDSTDQKKPDLTQVLGDLLVSGATVLAHSAAEAVVKRVRRSAAKTAPVKAVAKVMKKAKSAAPKTAKKNAKKTTKKTSVKKSAGKKTAKKSAKKTPKKKSKKSKR